MNPVAAVDYSLYLVTDEAMCAPHGGVVAVATQAVAGGVTLVQIRAKGLADDVVVEQVRQLRAALAGRPVPIIVNDSLSAAVASGADGLHLGQTDGDPIAAREALGRTAILGLSVSSATETAEALALPPGTVDYLGVGPVWATPTKDDAGEPLLESGTADLVAAAGGMPCVAIGGIGLASAPRLRGIGLAGICVVSAICAAEDPAAASSALLSAWRSA